MRDFLLMIHFIGLAMSLGTSFAYLFLGIIGGKMENSQRSQFQLNLIPLSNMGYIGLILLILSGIVLLQPYTAGIIHSPFLLAKLILVCILIILLSTMYFFSKKANRNQDVTKLQKVSKIGKITFIIGLGIVVLAVLSLH